MALSGIQIYKLLPKTNCKECSFPTCLAFAMKLASKQVELSACPYVSEESKKQLAESAAPPIRLITLKAGTEIKAGNEVVIFRHEKTFYNKTGLFIRVKASDPELAKSVAKADGYKVNYVGMDFSIDGFAVEADGDLVAAIKTIRGVTKRPLILMSKDVPLLDPSLGLLAGESVLIYAADSSNCEPLADLAKKHQAVLAVKADSLETLAELTQRIQGMGVENMVLDLGGKNMSEWLGRSTQVRKLAIKSNLHSLGYPVIAFPCDAKDEGIAAAQAIAKYAGFVVLSEFKPELLYPLLVLRENIYTDPQKPIQVQPGVYEINAPKPESPVLVTTNFSITYFSVANEVEGSGLPAWLVVTDAEGMSVLTAWAAGKFDAERIAKAIKGFDVASKVSKKRLVLPGHVAVLSGELEEELPDWDIRVGPPRGGGFARIYEAGLELGSQGDTSTGHPFSPVRLYSFLLSAMQHSVTFTFDDKPTTVSVPTNTMLSEAAQMAGLDIDQPCGGQGRCGRCAVQVTQGNVRRRSTLRLSPKDVEEGYALACQSVVESDVAIHVPPQEKIERRLTTDRVVAEITVPANYDYLQDQTVRRVHLRLNPPTMEDQTDDWSRLQSGMRSQANVNKVNISLASLQTIGEVLRAGEWNVTAVLEYPLQDLEQPMRLISLQPGLVDEYSPLWGCAIDIGTTTVSVWLVDLVSGQVKAQVAEYNGQIARGEDVISRIMYASKNDGREELRQRVLETINKLLEKACKRVKAEPEQVIKVSIAGNSTMIHLLLGIPAANIRLSPFITAVNHPPLMTASEIGVKIHPQASVDCLPGVASYVGADITAGVLSSGLDMAENVTLFLDVGTNGETVLGNRDWLVTCACSAGPAFEGAGVVNGMRATTGAIEEVWINSDTYEPTYRVIGGGKPKGICGSGLISLLSETFLTGLLDKAGNVNLMPACTRVREGAHGGEYVVAWGAESETGEDIVLSRVDVDNLLRAKAAIYAGFTVLADTVGVPLETMDKVLIGGSFGKYINVEKAVQIGLLPDMDWSRFEFLGNTSVKGAYYALLDWKKRERISEIAKRMTYIELSADNSFYEAFTSALFLPHTDMSKFPSVEAALSHSQVNRFES